MILQGIRHTGTFPDIYINSRKHLVISLRVAREETRECTLYYFSRDHKEKVLASQMQIQYRDGLFDYYISHIELSQVARYQKYYFRITGIDGEEKYVTATGIYEEVPTTGYYEYLYANDTDVLQIPDWAKGQIFYQIFPERFAKTDDAGPEQMEPWGTLPTRENYMGGTLRGITEHMNHIKDLGVGCIYLNPIFTAKFNHKYATIDYKEIDPQFGTKDDFRTLVETAHKYGIRIVLDGVFNHTGTDFFAFKDILEKQEKSKYLDWYYITKFPVEISHKNYECVGAYKYMPKLRSGTPEVREYIISVMEYWMDEFGIDGWRLDVADEVDPEVWNEARVRLKQKHSDALLLGETWGNGFSLMNGSRMDSIMNYVFRDATLEFVADTTIDAEEYANRMQTMLSNYPEEMNQAMYLVLDSHDTERTLFRCGEDIAKMKNAVAIQMMFPGAPAVYYGDEIGMTGDNDPDCRRCMEWDENRWNRSLLDYYQKLGKIRNSYSCIKTGKLLVNENEGRILGFIRWDEKDEIVVIVNSGDKEQTMTIPVLTEEDYLELETEKTYAAEPWNHTCGCNGDIYSYQGQIKLTMGAYETKILRRM